MAEDDRLAVVVSERDDAIVRIEQLTNALADREKENLAVDDTIKTVSVSLPRLCCFYH
jgi:hypothetical protein